MKYLKSRNIELNVQIEAKLTPFAVGEGSQLNLYQRGWNLHVYTQELFCVALSKLQFTKLQNGFHVTGIT